MTDLFSLIVVYAKGNPGAAVFLTELFKPKNLMVASPIVLTIESAPSLRGTNLWVLYSDLCGRDLNKVLTLCQNCPIDILEDACSRQDYSGRQLVAEYLN